MPPIPTGFSKTLLGTRLAAAQPAIHPFLLKVLQLDFSNLEEKGPSLCDVGAAPQASPGSLVRI